MLKINDKYYLDSDRFQFIVREKYIGTDGKRKGEEVFKDVAFCGNLFQVKAWIMQNEIRSDLTLLENIEMLA